VTTGPLQGKSEYTAAEAAAALGISLPDLRLRVRDYITPSEEDLANMPRMIFRPCDLLLLRWMAEQDPASAGRV